jgi:transglutaminase-like putative cysteine protease
MPLINVEINLQYQVGPNGADFILNIESAQTQLQRVKNECLFTNQNLVIEHYDQPSTSNRFLRFQALPGNLQIRYESMVEVTHSLTDPWTIPEVEIKDLPSKVLTFLYPSRYCQSDRLTEMAIQLFGGLAKGYARVEAIQAWIRRQVVFQMKSSNSMTSALETISLGAGVCRDFAHLMIGLCRAINIPARYTTGIDYGADPTLGPTDFHAYVEVYLGGRWYIFDPSGISIPMGLIRIGTGRDAADVSFATIFGDAFSGAPQIKITANEDVSKGWHLPSQCSDAISTDS